LRFASAVRTYNQLQSSAQFLESLQQQNECHWTEIPFTQAVVEAACGAGVEWHVRQKRHGDRKIRLATLQQFTQQQQ
jgi:hypothetical protein